MLRPFTILEGRTRVAKGARIGPFVRLVDTEVGEGAEILDHCLLRECVVGPASERRALGPRAPGEPASAPGARVGNFVELKKTSLGEGSKASHLSYLGDADDRVPTSTSAPAPSPATTTASTSTRRGSRRGRSSGATRRSSRR